ncbi:MAG: hypothetical protein IJC81_01830, partial [Clostridia bacterium]|nr:hypothetical protein [Clostridia bacterium]
MSKRILSVLLTVLMLLGMCPVVIPAAAAEENALPAVSLAAEASEEVIEIGTAADLAALMGKEETIEGNYKLTADIYLTEDIAQAPIGISAASHFTGTFDGDNHTIYGINLSGTNYVGLFGYIRDAEIKNLTIEGNVTVSGKESGCLVGYAHQNITISNCVNNCDFTSTGTGDSFGGIIGLLRNTYTNNALIENCVNNGDINGYRNVGGIIGYNNAHGTGNVTIKGCKNTGVITATCTNASSNIGGILGVSNSAVGTFNMTECLNEGAVSGYFHIGGMIGLLTGSDVNAATKNFNVTLCKNTGAITATRNSYSHVGGIIGQVNNVGNVSDCLNTGAVSAKNVYVGGIFGGSDSSVAKYLGAANCLNKTAVASEKGTHDYVNSIGGFLPAKPVGNCYYYGDLQGKVWTNGDAKSTQYTADCFDDLNANGNWVIAQDPDLAVFHTHDYVTYETVGTEGHHKLCACGAANATEAHTDDDTNGACDLCGGVTSCSHEGTEKTYEVVTLSTCSTKGVEKEICACGGETGVTRELPLNAEAHEAIDYVWQKDGDTYYYVCTACETRVVEQTEAPTVYVDALGQADPHIGNDAASGTANDEVLTIVEASRRLAKTGGTICLTDRYYISGIVTLAECEAPVTITSLIGGTAGKTGFYVEGSTRLILGGDTTFRYLYFFADKNVTRDLVFQCNWHNVTFADELATAVQGVVVAGTVNATGDDTAPANTTITLSGVNQWKSGVGTGSAFETVPTFYYKIFLGNRITEKDTISAEGNVISNKTVTLNTTEGVGYPEINDMYLITSSPVAEPLVQTIDHTTNVVLNGDTTVAKLMSGYINTDSGAGYLDNLNLTLNDNSDISSYYAVRNVKNIVMDVSTANEGRTVKATAPVFTRNSDTGLYVPDGTETITATYGSHSFASTYLAGGFKQGAQYNAMYAGRVTTTIEPECTFEEEVTTEPANGNDGVMTHTCTVCGYSYTTAIPFVCTDHVYVKNANGEYYCVNGCEVDAPVGNTITVSACTIEDGVATVVLTADIDDPIAAAALYVTAPEGFTLTGIEAGAALGDVAFEGATDLAKNPYKIAFINTTLENITLDGEFAVLTYNVSEEVDGSFVFVIAIDEAYNVDEQEVAITGVGGEFAVAAHTHDYKATVTAPTCTTAGYTTYKCECGDEYTADEVPALNHVGTKTE